MDRDPDPGGPKTYGSESGSATLFISQNWVFLCKFFNIPEWRIALPAKSNHITSWFYFSRSSLPKRVTIYGKSPFRIISEFERKARNDLSVYSTPDIQTHTGTLAVQHVRYRYTVIHNELPVHGFQSTDLWFKLMKTYHIHERSWVGFLIFFFNAILD